eukprot:12916140-Prorocentrum_lima.AAC.1
MLVTITSSPPCLRRRCDGKSATCFAASRQTVGDSRTTMMGTLRLVPVTRALVSVSEMVDTGSR